VAIENLSEAMAKAVADAKQNDPGELRKRIIELENALKKKPAPAPAAPKRVEVPVLKDAQITRLEKAVARLEMHR